MSEATATARTGADTDIGGEQPDLSALVGVAARTQLVPLAFFVSWHGVLTLAYSGFPEPLANLKATINEYFPLQPENSGSKWPKTSFAALKDGVTLTREQLAIVQDICRKHSEGLHKHSVGVDAVTLVQYTCRSLEDTLLTSTIQLKANEFDATVSEAQRRNVESVLREADDPGYWQMVAKDGSRESHYRGRAVGCTLVVPLTPQNTSLEFKEVFHQLQKEIEENLPGAYTFFRHNSKHITLRAIFDVASEK